jgi:hypothetical protein
MMSLRGSGATEAIPNVEEITSPPFGLLAMTKMVQLAAAFGVLPCGELISLRMT